MPPRKKQAPQAPSTMKELKDTLWKAADKLRGSLSASQYKDVNRPGMSGDSSSWKGWGHVRWFIEEVPAGAA
ncbi:C-terminal truncated type I restriction/modification system DNA methylase HsdM [Mycobacterium tuberculosis CCDC5079]|nr:type I restriction-modification system subunit M N-terminal domain-containing protein [Mycobacterium tuberculosis]AGM01345.1 C-terminal truncated type I restriction/modification system DNA methylase HsdM [Mycobacterium tuberculosis CCDC5079]ASZ27123.1 hypothetical protein CK481_15060 [Mycobacterium tuberculosis]